MNAVLIICFLYYCLYVIFKPLIKGNEWGIEAPKRITSNELGEYFLEIKLHFWWLKVTRYKKQYTICSGLPIKANSEEEIEQACKDMVAECRNNISKEKASKTKVVKELR